MGLIAVDLVTDRLVLTPLRIEDAETMADVLADERMHEFIGGRPAARGELRTRYRMLTAGSGDPDEVWLNWIVRMRATDEPVGTVQATVTIGSSAYVAWLIGVPWQGQGFAGEAATVMADWLRAEGVPVLLAAIHPMHSVSEGVAKRIGLHVTDEQDDGERIWCSAGH
ncbi:MAG TPA: GNAT family N-acetyltransferase [Pseudonocardiaceae bacterium]|nr:GNAT family N-acetyltransferase [Pseudonocardiaceae bacterium]